MTHPFTRTTTPHAGPVRVRDLSVTFGGRQVIDSLDLLATTGQRIGLVGENGSGKSTLLRAIAGRAPERAVLHGSVETPADLGFLGQEAPFRDDHTVGQVLAHTLAPLRELVRAVEELSAHLDDEDAAARYAEALDRAVALDAWDADRRAEVSAARLGLDHLDPTRAVGSLSGGQRTRLALAALMTTRPSALLLDEPTNHLDDDAVQVLTEFLTGLDGVVLLASHDRVLLDEVCTDLVDLEPGEFGTDGSGSRRFGGGWSEYVAWRDAARARWEQTWAEQQVELQRLRAATKVTESDVAKGRGPTDNDKFIHAFKGSRVQGTVARRRRDAERRLADAEAHQVRKPRPPLRFDAPLATAGPGGRLVQVRDVVVDAPDGTPRVRVSRLDIHAGEHLLVTGTNGVGKSTLLGVLAGRLTPTRGTVDVAARRVVELVQDVRFADPTRTPTQIYTDATGEDATPLHDLGLVHPRDLARPVGLLSVGQRRRLGLALAVAAEPDLLLLDEPTNHLSLALAGEIEEALAATPGTVVLASHDRWLRRRWQGGTLALTAP